MGFDDANHQEPPDRAEYEAWEKEEKRKLSECCCCEGDFRFCHGEVSRLNLQVDGLRKLMAKALCDCGPYTETNPTKHDALGCRYRNCIEKAEGDGMLTEKRKCACLCHVGGEGSTTACGCCSYTGVRS